MHPALRSVQGNVLTLHPRRPELQRQAEIDQAVQRALVAAIRARPSREPVSQYAATDKVVRRGLWILVGLAVIGHMLAGLPT